MTTYQKIPLSNSEYGKSIVVTETGVSGTLIHETSNISGSIDEVWLYGSNVLQHDCLLTLRIGGSGISGDTTNINLDAYAGLTLLCPGLILKDDGDGALPIYASVLSGYQSGVNIFGYINRISI